MTVRPTHPPHVHRSVVASRGAHANTSTAYIVYCIHSALAGQERRYVDVALLHCDNQRGATSLRVSQPHMTRGM